MPKPTLIRNAAWAVLWDAAAGRHVYARDVDIVLRDGRGCGQRHTSAATDAGTHLRRRIPPCCSARNIRHRCQGAIGI